MCCFGAGRRGDKEKEEEGGEKNDKRDEDMLLCCVTTHSIDHWTDDDKGFTHLVTRRRS